ncbi:hypothetical protein [Bartonella pachyuromydis]|uniref:Lipoprotein n=1 Tax=Bartonella pachyuromydis TaxID=931097 RepID=A0ABP8VH88_9HYPH
MKKREVKILPAGILGICFMLTGCGVSAPTYGTDKPVSLQFFEDVANIASLTPTNDNSQLVMKPHPKLVIPKFSSRLVLPVPQQNTAASKQHSDGKVAVFPKKQLSVNEYTSATNSENTSQLRAAQRQEYLRRQRARVGSAQYRRYLTEPPLSYRQPAKIAPVGK